MLQALIGPLTELAGGWLKGKADRQAAESKLKLTEAEAKAKILVSKETSIQDWEKILAGTLLLMGSLLWKLCLTGINTHLVLLLRQVSA